MRVRGLSISEGKEGMCRGWCGRSFEDGLTPLMIVDNFVPTHQSRIAVVVLADGTGEGSVCLDELRRKIRSIDARKEGVLRSKEMLA